MKDVNEMYALLFTGDFTWNSWKKIVLLAFHAFHLTQKVNTMTHISLFFS